MSQTVIVRSFNVKGNKINDTSVKSVIQEQWIAKQDSDPGIAKIR